LNLNIILRWKEILTHKNLQRSRLSVAHKYNQIRIVQLMVLVSL
jgi:hypothetical protein